MYLHIHICTYTYTYTCTYTYIFTDTYANIHKCIHSHAFPANQAVLIAAFDGSWQAVL